MTPTHYPPPIDQPWLTPKQLNAWARQHGYGKADLRTIQSALKGREGNAIPIVEVRLVATFERRNRRPSSAGDRDGDSRGFATRWSGDDFSSPSSESQYKWVRVGEPREFDESVHGQWLGRDTVQGDFKTRQYTEQRIIRRDLAQWFLDHAWLIPPGCRQFFEDAAEGKSKAVRGEKLDRQLRVASDFLTAKGIPEDEWLELGIGPGFTVRSLYDGLREYERTVRKGERAEFSIEFSTFRKEFLYKKDQKLIAMGG